MPSQVVYGTRIHGSLPPEFQPYFVPLENTVQPLVGELNVRFCQIETFPSFDEFWVESHENSDGSSRFALFRSAGGFGLSIQCQGRGLFRITKNQIEIGWMPGGTGAAHYFFSYAMPLWLEYCGVLVLHASAVALNGVSIAFLGKSGAGKSSLAAGLTELGASLVADDGLPVMERRDGRWLCLAGPPLIKLWPKSLDLLKKRNTAQFHRVHELFEKRIVPHGNELSVEEDALSLAAVYILTRNEEPRGFVQIESAGDAAAPVRLIEHSLGGGPASALGLSAERFQQLARLARNIPLKILSYPSEASNFPQIMNALLADINVADLHFNNGFTSDSAKISDGS